MEKSSPRGNKNKSMTQEQKDYAAFEEKVKRTVYLDNLSPLVTVPVLNTALGQFGKVVEAQVLPNYMDTKSAPICALVEMQSEREAKNTVTEVTVNAFMIAGAPRPARAKLAKAEMFPDRPAVPGRRIQCYWVDPSDPDWEAALRRKQLVKKHIAEAAYLLKHQREEEEKLGEHQEQILRNNYKKYEMIEGLFADGTNEKLLRRYGLDKKE